MTKLLLNKGSLGCILVLLLLFVSCGDNIRDEIIERYDDGQKKFLIKYKGEGSNEVIVKKISYYENGQIKEEKNYKDGKLDGKYTRYYKNGQIKEETNYKDGKLNGKVITYYENGQIKEEGNYKDGRYTGYYKNGQIKEERNYKDGVKID